MSCLFWNACGLESSQTLDKLCDLLCSICPSLVFLIETKLNGCKARDFVGKVGFSNHMVIDSQGRSRGFILL